MTCCDENEVTGKAERPTTAPRRTFRIEGLDCAEEVALLKQAVGPLVGGEDHLAFDLLHGRMHVLSSARPVSDRAIQRAVARVGLRARPWQAGMTEETQRNWQGFFTLLSGLALLTGMGLHLRHAGGMALLSLFAGHTGAVPLDERIAFGLAIGFGMPWVLVKAVRALLRLRPDMNLLMSLAVAGALALGEWFEAATVTFLFALALTLERWSVARARRAVTALLETAPETARVKLADGRVRAVPVAEVQVGMRVLVPPGEKVPVDGRVVAGHSSVNQAPITGESLPVPKGPGDEVFAGTLNGEGLLEVVVEKPAQDSTLARIIRLVAEAQERKAGVEQWVERFARRYTPAVFAGALLVWIVPPLMLGASWNAWFYRALVLLVIACPCALVISTPVSLVAALARAAREGVLIKGGVFLERSAGLTLMAFDKTGTLTLGKPQVVQVVSLAVEEMELLALAAALERGSTHPLAEAVCRCAAARGCEPPLAEGVRALPGRGIEGSIGSRRYWLGSLRLARERVAHWPEGLTLPPQAEVGTVVALGQDARLLGLIVLSDAPRPEAETTVAALRRLGIRCAMLTGDHRRVAERIAQDLGIEEVHAELLPEDKVRVVEALAREYRAVAMVGDGINDAPALARADVGIALGAIGSDAAIEAADIALMSDDLRHLPWLVRHARRTLWIVRENITFALGVKAVFVVLALLGQATLWMAVAADMGASLLVVANGLRLLRIK
ncbi:MAG TPA: cadmium-translocating P-type ATPase [Gammaproteobacteria bacterium]|nr:cadmium-translocating P-type ATPase [Gammaproteobacteria bacterium]